MAVNLTISAQEVDAEADSYVRLFQNLQNNIVKPHGRNSVHHILVEFTGSVEAVRAWIRTELAPRIPDAATLYQQAREREQARAEGRELVDGGPVFGFYISAKGYPKLGFEPKNFGGEAFRDGMKDPNDALGDRIFGTVNKDPKWNTWETPYQDEIHALITVADDDPAVSSTLAEAMMSGPLSTIAHILTVEVGKVLRKSIPGGNPAGEPIEHFGYLDGLSNPRFTMQDIAKEKPKDGDGNFWDVGAPLDLVLVHDPFVDEVDAYGSFLVFRKLAQDVPLFNERVVALAASIPLVPDLAGALVVGRFKDGTPVISSPSDGQAWTNDFDFSGENNISRCPAQAHIRKVNPRGTTPLTSLKGERKRRIVRRGIPYGRPLPGIAKDGEETGSVEEPRGLLFMCFQHDIEEQFEFIQHTWVDNEEFPNGLLPFTKDTGDDPLIGQVKDSVHRWPKRWDDDDAGIRKANFESAVTLRGGEYFFAPSMSFLRSL